MKKEEPEKYCVRCGVRLHRKRYNGTLEDYGCFLRRKYCGMDCSHRTFRKESVTLAGLRKRAVRFRGPMCGVCGSTVNVGIHHKDSDPSNNADENLLTLCGSCHTKLHWKNGKTMPTKARKTCSVCGKKTRTHDGMCQKHYQRWKKYGDPLLTAKIGGRSSMLLRVSVDD